jgi:uncharacterized membrane protein (UPF0136 family)
MEYMEFIYWDTMTFLNLTLCVVTLVVAIIGYQRSKSRAVLSVGVAFGLFGLSYLVMLFGLHEAFYVILILVRTLAYLLVLYALYLTAFQGKK